MVKTTLFALAAVAALGACSTTPPQSAAPQIVTNVHPLHPGTGVIQSVTPAPVMAGAGSSAEPMQRLEIKMDNGRMTYVDTPSRELAKGDRIQLSEDRVIRKL
jgi:hypothetical protein